MRLDNTKRDSILLFLIWPFFAVTYAIRNYKAVWAKNIIWFFVVFYGFTITIHNIGEETIDANRYRTRFEDMAKEEVTFQNFTSLLYDEDAKTVDVIEITIVFLLSRVTSNYHILFAVFGLIFGYFYSRNIWYLIEQAGGKITAANIPVILTFAFIVGFWEINGFRFWAATHIFLYGTLRFLYEGKKKYVWLSVLSAFMHFSFFLPVGILGIYAVLGRRTNLYFFLFIFTFFMKELNLSQIREFLMNNLPSIFLPRVKTYTTQEYADKVSDALVNVNWYVVLYRDLLKWTVVTFLILIFLRGKKFMKRYNGFENLFSFILLFYSIANIFSLMPSGGRFVIVSNLFSMAAIFLYVQFSPREKTMKRLISIAVPALALYSIVSLRVALDTMGFFSVFGNPLLSVFIDVDITLIEVVKSFVGVK